MRFPLIRRQLTFKVSLLLAVIILFILGQPAAAHHPFSGETPNNFFEGFLSGLGHPIIGLDHFAFIVASGLLGAKFKQGFLIPVSFVLATIGGTGIHLQAINLPQTELIIASSVIIFGGLLVIKNGPLFTAYFSTIIVATLAMIAGIFHGYAYGEAIIGAEMNPLVAYLAGFALIQLLISLSALAISHRIHTSFNSQSYPILRIIGIGIIAVGFVCLGKVFGV